MGKRKASEQAAPPAGAKRQQAKPGKQQQQPAAAAGAQAGGAVVSAAAEPRNKEKVLLIGSRGIPYRCAGRWRRRWGLELGRERASAASGGGGRRATFRPASLPPHLFAPPPPVCRFRHLMLDLGQLLPHSKRDSKLDTKSERGVINEVADLKVGGGRGFGCCGVEQAFQQACMRGSRSSRGRCRSRRRRCWGTLPATRAAPVLNRPAPALLPLLPPPPPPAPAGLHQRAVL